MNTELKPCPFCGSKAVSVKGGSLRPNGIPAFGCHCPKCHSASGIFETPQEAITAWNRRVPDEPENM